MQNRLLAPDFIKGLSITLMVYGHITQIGDLKVCQDGFREFIYIFKMPLFLIIAGFFFKFKNNLKQQLFNYSLRVGVPYLIFIILYLIGLSIIPVLGIRTTNIAPSSLVTFLRAIFIHPIGAFWFLHSLMLINFVLILGKWLFSNEDTFLMYLFNFLCFLILHNLNLISLNTVIYFIIGFIIKELIDKEINISIYYAVILVPIVAYFYFNNLIERFSIEEFICILFVFAILWGFAAFFKNSLFVKTFAWVGQNTLIILLLHPIIINGFKPLQFLFLKVDPTGVSYSVIVTFIAVSTCILISRVFDILSISRFVFHTTTLYRGRKIIQGYTPFRVLE